MWVYLLGSGYNFRPREGKLRLNVGNSMGGKEPLKLENREERTFLQDGDTVYHGEALAKDKGSQLDSEIALAKSFHPIDDSNFF